MSFDELQSEWQAHNHEMPLNLTTERLLNEVRRNHRSLETTLFWRDAREIVVAVILTAIFVYLGQQGGSWSYYVVAVGCFWVGAFMLLDRWFQKRHRSSNDASLRSSIQASLIQVNHQIWLLKNIFWWYLLPIAIGMVAVIGDEMWKKRAEGLVSYMGQAAYIVFCFLLFYGGYWLNQRAVEKELEPRRKELQTLLASLRS